MCDEKTTPGDQATTPSKMCFRRQVWDSLEKSKLVNFPRPIYGRIPNFKGAEEAAARLLELEEFRTAKVVDVNPDKPLEASRALVVEQDKVLYVPVPHLQGFLKRISFCREDKPQNVRLTVTRWGIEALGKDVDLGEKIHVDVLLLGSVAVARDGRRIGKGKGYADLEYAILKELGAVDDSTIIVTTVHESQVFDSLPEEIFGKHDVPVDYILTPDQVIKVEKRLERPQGIYWDLLSQRRLNLVPVLQKIKNDLSSSGREISLKEDTDDEQEEKRRILKTKTSRSRSKSRRYSETGLISNRSAERSHKRSYFKRSVSAKLRKEIIEDKENELLTKKKTRPFRKNSRKIQIDFSLFVSNIDKSVRVRHLKDALINHGIKPSNITWRGYKGFCYLHYAKPLKNEEDVEKKAFAVDSVIEILQTLKLNEDASTGLNVKIMEPITRIETTDVTAV